MDTKQAADTGREEAARAAADSPAAGRIADDIRERMSSLRPQAAEGVQHAADAAHHAAGTLRGEEEWMAQLIEQGAAKLSSLADTLRTNDLQALLAKSQQFARRQPVLFTGAAMALGFALARAATAAAHATSRSTPTQERGNADG